MSQIIRSVRVSDNDGNFGRTDAYFSSTDGSLTGILVADPATTAIPDYGVEQSGMVMKIEEWEYKKRMKVNEADVEAIETELRAASGSTQQG